MCRKRSFATSGRGGFPARAAGGLLRVTRFDFRWRHGAGRRARSYTRRVFVDGDDDDPSSFQVSRRMSRHAVRATVAVAALSLAVLGSPVQAQDTPSAAQELADLRARAEGRACRRISPKQPPGTARRPSRVMPGRNITLG